MRRADLFPTLPRAAGERLASLLHEAEDLACVSPAQAAHAALEALGPVWMRPDERERILGQLELQARVWLERYLG